MRAAYYRLALLTLSTSLSACGGGGGGGDATSTQSMASYPAGCISANFTNTNFSVLKIGMNPPQVAAIFNCQGVLTAGVGATLTYEWVAYFAQATVGGSSSATFIVDATFTDGSLTAFSKSGF